MEAMNTPRSVWGWIAGNRTDNGWMSGLSSTSEGQRKSFHDARTANTLTTARIGRDIGSTTEKNSRTGPAPSTFAASKISRGRLSKKRFTRITLNALAHCGSQTAQ